MIRLFNVNNPSVTVFLFAYAVVLNLILFIEPDYFPLPQPQAPLAQLFFFITDVLFGNNRFALAVIAIILQFAQALLINNIVNTSKLFDTGTFVPSLVYITLTSLFREFLFLSPALLSVTFIILALGKSLRFFRQQRCFAEVFDMGLLIAMATLFYKPIFLLLILLFVTLVVMRSFNWREWVIGLSGFVTVFFLTGTIYYLIDQLPAFKEYVLAPAIIPENHLETSLSFSLIAGFTILLALVSVFFFLFNFLKSAVLARKFMTLSMWTLLLLALSSLFVRHISIDHFVILGVPLTPVISYLFMNIRKARAANILHFIWMTLALIFQYYQP